MIHLPYSDKDRFYSVLCDTSTKETSNINEEFYFLFDDSGLGKLIDQNNLGDYFSASTVDKIIYFEKILRQVSCINFCDNLNHPKVAELFDKAKELLFCIKTELK